MIKKKQASIYRIESFRKEVNAKDGRSHVQFLPGPLGETRGSDVWWEDSDIPITLCDHKDLRRRTS